MPLRMEKFLLIDSRNSLHRVGFLRGVYQWQKHGRKQIEHSSLFKKSSLAIFVRRTKPDLLAVTIASWEIFFLFYSGPERGIPG